MGRQDGAYASGLCEPFTGTSETVRSSRAVFFVHGGIRIANMGFVL